MQSSPCRSLFLYLDYRCLPAGAAAVQPIIIARRGFIRNCEFITALSSFCGCNANGNKQRCVAERGELEGRMMACSSGVVRSVMPSRSGFINKSDSL
jgi:hypothetical protein